MRIFMLYYLHPKLLFSLFLFFSFSTFQFCPLNNVPDQLPLFTYKQELKTNQQFSDFSIPQQGTICYGTSSSVTILTADFTSIPKRKGPILILAETGLMSRLKRTTVIVQIISHLGLAMLSQNIFPDEREGQRRRKVRGLASEEVKSKKLGR